MLVLGDSSIAEWVRVRLPLQLEFGDCIAVGIQDDKGILQAGVVYYNYCNRNIEISIASNTPRWATKENISGILSYPFVNLNCRRVTAVTSRKNDHVRSFLKRIGFMHEGTLHDALDNDDAVIYGMTKKFFLRSKWNG